MQQTINKKFNILQELQQAIKRKAIDKQRSREHTNKQLLLSIDKRRAESKSIQHREKTSDKRQSRKTPNKQQHYIMKPFLLRDENAMGETIEKKSVGKRIEKLFSLVNYTISSAEKAIKFVNTANFEAEFAVKLFKSDRDSLLLEIETFMKGEQQQSKSPTSDNRKGGVANLTNLENHSLKNENATLRKQNLIVEAEISKLKEEKTLLAEQLRNIKTLLNSEDRRQRGRIKDKEKQIDNLLKEIHDIDEVKRFDKSRETLLKHNLFLKEKQVEKIKSKMREVYPLETLEKFFELIEKETKFNMMMFNNYDNTRKKGELEVMIKSLQTERLNLDKKLVANETKPNSRYAELHNYIIIKILPLIEGYNSSESIPDIEILELFMKDMYHSKQKKDRNTKDAALEKQIAQLKNEKASLTNQVQILKIQNSKDKSDQLKKVSKENELLQTNLQEIYDDLSNICVGGGLIKNDVEEQPDFQQLICVIREFVNQRKEGRLQPEAIRNEVKTNNDPDRKILAVELATEKKINREKSKLIEEMQQASIKQQERIAELETDLEKLTNRIEKLDAQKQVERQANQKTKQYEGELHRANDRIKTLEEEADMREKTKIQLLDALRESKKQIQSFEAKLQKKDKKEKGLDDTIQQMRKSQDFLKLQLEKIKQQKISVEESLGMEIDSLREKLGDMSKQTTKSANSERETKLLKEENLRLQTELNELKETQKKQDEKLETLKKEKKAIEKTVTEQQSKLAETANRAQGERKHEIEQIKLEASRLNEQMLKTSTIMRHLQESNKCLHNENVQLLSHVNRFEMKESIIEEEKRQLQQTINKLQADTVKQANDGDDYTERLQKELSFLEQELKEMKNQNNRMRDQLQSQHQKVKSLTSQLENYTQKEQTQLQAKENQIKHTQINNGLISSSQHGQTLVEPLTEEITALNKEVDKYKRLLNEQLSQKFQSDIQRINRIEKEHRIELAKLTKQTKRITEVKMQLESKLAERELKMDESAKHQKNLKAEVDMLNERIKQMTKETTIGQALSSKVQQLQLSLTEKQTKINELNVQLTKRMTNISRLQDELSRTTSKTTDDGSTTLLKKYIEENEKEKDINRMKMSNYTSLVKSILKKIVTIDDLEDEDFDTLLERGAQKVFEWKKTKNWESQYKDLAGRGRETEEIIQPFGLSAEKKYKAEQDISSKKQKNETGMADFEDLQNISLEDSIIHEIDIKSNGDFHEADQEQQTKAQVKKEDVVHHTLENIASLSKEEKHKKELITEDGEKVNNSPVNIETTPLSTQETQTNELVTKQQPHQIKQELNSISNLPKNSDIKQLVVETEPVHDHPTPIDFQHALSPINRNNTDGSGFRDFVDLRDSSMSESMASDREFVQQVKQEHSPEHNVEQPIINAQSNKQTQIDKVQEDEFADYKEESMSGSMISDRGIPKQRLEVLDEAQTANLKLDVNKQEPQVQQPVAEEDQFADYKDNSMSKSMLSDHGMPEVKIDELVDAPLILQEQKQEKQLHQQKAQEDQFADFKDNSMNASMMSDVGIKQSTGPAQQQKSAEEDIQGKKSSLNEFADFEEAEMSHSRSIRHEDIQQEKGDKPVPSSQPPQTQPQIGADFNDFGSFHNQSLSKSQISNNNHFEDFPDELEKALDSSMLSETPMRQVNQANLHNILEGQNLELFEHEHKAIPFEDFLQSEIRKKEQSEKD